MIMGKHIFYLTITCLFYFSIPIEAQNFNCTIEGKVISDSTGKPLENVNVYLSGTTCGTTTNKSGYFKISPIPSGTQKVVASIIGYKPAIAEVTLKEKSAIEIQFYLKEITYELSQVEVTGKVPEDWKENLEVFKNKFFGEGAFASECTIANPEVINLSRTNSDELIANSVQPIIIINHALGYKITCNLITFNWNEKIRKLQYLTDSYFSELIDSAGKMKEDWIENRKKAYNGSLVNFIKSLINGTLNKEKFSMSLDKSLSLIGMKWPYLGEPDIKVADDSSVVLNFKDYLRVEYEPYRIGRTKVSWIKLNQSNVIFDKYGYPLDLYAINIYGYWSLKGIAYTLPKYYNP